MAEDTSTITDNGAIPEQSITTAQPVLVTPTTDQPVRTQVTGPATTESSTDTATMSLAGEALQTVVSNPRELAYLLYGSFGIAAAVLLFSLYRWEVLGDVRAGEIVHAFGNPINNVVFLLIGVCFQMARFAPAAAKSGTKTPTT